MGVNDGNLLKCLALIFRSREAMQKVIKLLWHRLSICGLMVNSRALEKMKLDLAPFVECFFFCVYGSILLFTLIDDRQDLFTFMLLIFTDKFYLN